MILLYNNTKRALIFFFFSFVNAARGTTAPLFRLSQGFLFFCFFLFFFVFFSPKPSWASVKFAVFLLLFLSVPYNNYPSTKAPRRRYTSVVDPFFSTHDFALKSFLKNTRLIKRFYLHCLYYYTFFALLNPALKNYFFSDHHSLPSCSS